MSWNCASDRDTWNVLQPLRRRRAQQSHVELRHQSCSAAEHAQVVLEHPFVHEYTRSTPSMVDSSDMRMVTI
jgi:hypothetical protein